MRRGLLAALLSLLALGCGQGAGDDPSRAVVLVSGLDDHYLPESAEVPLHARPDGPVRTQIPAGTLVRPLEVRGQWTKVEALESHAHTDADDSHADGPMQGWVGDYYLRGRMHAINSGDPMCPVPTWAEPGGDSARPLDASAQVELLEVRPEAVRMWVKVRTVLEPSREAWVSRDSLSEYSSLQLTEGLGHVHGDGGPEPVESTGDC